MRDYGLVGDWLAPAPQPIEFTFGTHEYFKATNVTSNEGCNAPASQIMPFYLRKSLTHEHTHRIRSVHEKFNNRDTDFGRSMLDQPSRRKNTFQSSLSDQGRRGPRRFDQRC